MRLTKFMSEGVSVHDTDENIADFLHKECSQFFKETKGMRLFRGAKKSIWAFEKFTARDDRIPKDTPKQVHEYVDNWCQKKFGWKPRSQGVFVSPTSEQAEYYGTVYWFLPCNGYKYIYSPIYADLTGDLEDAGLIKSRSGAYLTTDEWWNEKERDREMDRILSTYTNKDIKKVSGMGYEASFFCPNGYYLLNTEWVSDGPTRYFTIYGG